MTPSFQQRLREVDSQYEIFGSLQTLQVNLGNLCNLRCRHCHVAASPVGSTVMGIEIMAEIAAFLKRHPGLILDITGGCPEMNPHFTSFIADTENLAQRRLLRSNLVIMAEKGWEWLPEFCSRHRLSIIGSLPCYLQDNVDRQRGAGVYGKSIDVLKRLNALGYGTELELNLTYNPGGAFIPGPQQELESAYKENLCRDHGIVFNRLFALANAPIGRFSQLLEAEGRYDGYVGKLEKSFNPAAAANIMCRSLISVDWQGVIYNCDFNQALHMPVVDDGGQPVTIAGLEGSILSGKKIRFADHCFCCTAGEGSSCTGALAV